MSKPRRAIVAHVTVNLIGIDGDETTILDSRQGTQGGTNVEHVRRRAHDMIDAYVYGLASRLPAPLGDNLESVETFGSEGIVVLDRRHLDLVFDALDRYAVELTGDERLITAVEQLLAELRRQDALAGANMALGRELEA